MDLNEALSKKGWTAYRLSKETGISEYQISRIRNGSATIDNMATKNALAIADALGVSIRDLLSNCQSEAYTEK